MAETKQSASDSFRVSARMRARVSSVLALLQARYPEPETHLIAADPWQLLVATILSAQCTDARVNLVTPELFRRWPTPRDLSGALQADVEECIRSTGFYRNKAKNIIAAATRVIEVYGGRVPDTMADLLTLGGVARKTASVVLWGAFRKNEGVAVDTHVGRIAYRLGWTSTVQPGKAEKELMALLPQEEWGHTNHRLVWFGRHVCTARKPRCSACELAPHCPKKGLPKSG